MSGIAAVYRNYPFFVIAIRPMASNYRTKCLAFSAGCEVTRLMQL
jgi:hypothetical protein